MTRSETPWGRVDAEGTVYVREGDGERAVGQYPDGTPEEALAYFERKYSDLEGQVTLLEQRARRGASARDVGKAIKHLAEAITEAHAVGDLAALQARLDALQGVVGELSEQQLAEQAKELEQAKANREQVVIEAEALAAQDLAQVQWKQISKKLDTLFERWQALQHGGPRLPKSESDALWKRFRAARNTIETARKAFYAELDSAQREARQAKKDLISRAEALTSKGVDGIPAYRALLEDWKRIGRAGRKYDDALWASFKAAGDVLFGAKAEADAAENEVFAENLSRKQELLEEAQSILQITDLTTAREALLKIQTAWDAIGKVPRDSVKTIEGGLRAVENHVKKLEEEHWRLNNPEKKARSEGLSSQLTEAIEKLEAELTEARANNDKRGIKEAEEALAARKIWLEAIR